MANLQRQRDTTSASARLSAEASIARQAYASAARLTWKPRTSIGAPAPCLAELPRATPALPDSSRFYQVHALLTVSLRPPTGSISKCDGPGPRFLALFTSTSRRYVVGGPADNIPVGGPLIGGERAYRVRPILEGAHRGRHFREPRVRSERGQTSAQPLTLTRAVTRAGTRNSTPGSETAAQLEDRQRRDGRSGRQPTPADRSQRGTGSQLQPRGASGREWQNAPGLQQRIPRSHPSDETGRVPRHAGPYTSERTFVLFDR